LDLREDDDDPALEAFLSIVLNSFVSMLLAMEPESVSSLFQF
jgi:hypothetical protein